MKIRLGRNEEGSILLLAMVTAGVIGMTLASYLKLVEQQNMAVMRSQIWNSAIPVCEAGIEEALTHINVVLEGNRATNGWVLVEDQFQLERSFGDTRYVVKISQDILPVVTSVGYVKVPLKTNEISRSIRVTTTTFNAMLRGMVAKGAVDMGSNTRADSFDSEDPNFSTGGRYDPDKNRDQIFIGSLEENVAAGKVWGGVGTGPEGGATGDSVGDAAWVDGGNSGIQTGHWQKDMNMNFLDVELPFSGGAFTPGSGDYTRTNYTYLTNLQTSFTYPNPDPGGVSTINDYSVTSSSPPTVSNGPITTNTAFTSSTTYPASGTYLGNVVTRTETTGTGKNRTTTTYYDYYRISGYTYTTTAYQWSLINTNQATSTAKYAYILNDGNYELESLVMSGSEKMIVDGDAVLHIKGDIDMTGQSQIIITPGSTLQIFVEGNVKMAGNGVSNETDLAENFWLFGTETCTEISMTGNASFTGVIYAPDADFKLGGGGNDVYDCVGATVTKSVTMNGHFNFHYDEKLRRLAGISRFFVASWNEIIWEEL